MDKHTEPFALMFAPERWTPVKKFQAFMGAPFKLDRELRSGTAAAEHHFEKFYTLAGLANALRPSLADDHAELETKGFTPATRSREFAALMETLVCELYSVLDGLRRALYSAYRGVPKVQNSSTKTLFERAYNNEYGVGFPETIRAALALGYIDWFEKLRSIRTEVTHGDIGSCNLDFASNVVSYMHSGLGTSTHAFVVNDIVGEINGLAKGVRSVLDECFSVLCSSLQPVEKRVSCGFFKGYLYERDVAVEDKLSLASGRCHSKQWFDAQPGSECPLRGQCGAYLAV